MKFQVTNESVNNIFDFLSGNSGLTEEYIYSIILNKGKKYKLLTGSNEIDNCIEIPKCNNPKKSTEKIKTYSGQGIHIIRKGKAGTITYLKKGNYTLNDDAYLLYKKKNCKLDINLKWFAYKFQSLFYQFSSFSDNGTWNKTDFFKYAKIDIPIIEEQLSMLKKYDKLNLIKKNVIKIKSKINKLSEKYLIINNEPEQIKILSELVEHISRNDCLSEEGIYKRSENIKKTKDKIKVISGSIENYYGIVPINKNLHYVKNKPCLQVVTRGKAGVLKFHSSGNYATNTNAMLLIIREDKKSLLKITNPKEEENYLKFLEYYLTPLFNNYCSNSDVSVFPLTEVITQINIPLFKSGPVIEKIIQKYEIIQKYKRKLNELLIQISNILNKEIA